MTSGAVSRGPVGGRLGRGMSIDALRMGSSAGAGLDRQDRAQLSSLYGVFVLSSLMFDGRGPDAILELAANAVPSLAQCNTDAVYRVLDGTLTDSRDPERRLDGALDTVVAASLGMDQEISLADADWRYAITLRAVHGILGVFVIRGQEAVSPDELFLVKVLAQQTAAAVRSSDLIEQERHQRVLLSDLTEERKRTIRRLSRSVAELERHKLIHEALTAVSGSGAGEAGIAEALNRLTSMTVAVEDVFGNLRAWSGSPAPSNYRPIGGSNREDVLRQAAANGKPEREGERLFCIIRPRTDILGVLVLHGPERAVDRLHIFALEHAATVLALELAHQRALAEAEVRLRRDLVEDLLAGTDDESAYSRAEALGHNLRSPHTVTVLEWKQPVKIELVAKAARHWASGAGLHALTAHRPTMAILLTDDVPQPIALHRAMCAALGNDSGSIGIGAAATMPSELPRSLSEALRALQVQKASISPHGSRRFDDLGVYRIFDPDDRRPEVRGFVSEWLGPLLAYDHNKGAELVKTLARYLDSGGNYDQAAHALCIHRSTLRYRLGRIREITGRDLQDVDARLNLHLATRVIDVIGTDSTGSEHH
jgi:sugar diacid utilization regulator